MLSNETSEAFTKENLDFYLRELGKEFRRINGKTMPAEIILIGGASVLANYGFRELTYDMDAIIQATSVMKDALNRIGDKYSLPTGWLNADFQNTKSYTPKLIAVSKYYKTFSNVLTVRTVSAEYLVAMKLMSGRKYKNDLSDVIGILHEHEMKESPISFAQIKVAVNELYGAWDKLPLHSIEFAEKICSAPTSALETFYLQYRMQEQKNSVVLHQFDAENPHVLKEDNINEVLMLAHQKERENLTANSMRKRDTPTKKTDRER